MCCFTEEVDNAKSSVDIKTTQLHTSKGTTAYLNLTDRGKHLYVSDKSIHLRLRVSTIKSASEKTCIYILYLWGTVYTFEICAKLD